MRTALNKALWKTPETLTQQATRGDQRDYAVFKDRETPAKAMTLRQILAKKHRCRGHCNDILTHPCLQQPDTVEFTDAMAYF
ncbi:MAG: hypothetical protein ACFBSF_20660 [Leptolyngbyaceae cyanobacterium]